MKSKNLFYLFAVAAVGFMVATGCEPTNPAVVPQVSNVTFTECNDGIGTRNTADNSVVVVFTNFGVNITHYGLVVNCAFDTVIINQIFENGVLTITERGEPNNANCMCHTDVSYTISGISESNVNMIVINGNVVWTADQQPPQPENPLVGLWYSQEPYIGLVPYIEFTADNRFLHHFQFENWNYNLICDTLILTNPINNQECRFLLSFVNENEIIIYNFSNGSINASVKNIHFIRQQPQNSDFCNSVQTSNFQQIVEITNDFLATIDNSLSDNVKIEILRNWLLEKSCVQNAEILCVSCIYTYPAISELSITFFNVNGALTTKTMDVQMGNPMRCGFHTEEYINNEVSLNFQQIYQNNNFSLKFDSVLNDSRCPLNAACVWAGNAEVKFIYVENSVVHSFVLNIGPYGSGSNTTFGNVNIKLVELLPHRSTQNIPIPQEDYVAKVLLTTN